MAESLQNIKRRASGVQNIGKITKAMELVAATKMRKSQEIALSSRAYAFAALELLGTLSEITRDPEHGAAIPEVLTSRPITHTAYVLVTSDKGLAGSFNSAVIRSFEKYVREKNIDITHEKNIFLAVGQKAARYLERRARLTHAFTRIGDFTTLTETRPVSDFLTNGYLEHTWDEVIVFSTHFRSALKQEVLIQKIFPIDVEAIRNTIKEIAPARGKFAENVIGQSLVSGHQSPIDYLLEPSPETLLAHLGAHLVEMQMYHLILEANASEHAARRFAMKSASDNASDLSEKLSLVYNKARQAAITKELVEITAGAETMK